MELTWRVTCKLLSVCPRDGRCCPVWRIGSRGRGMTGIVPPQPRVGQVWGRSPFGGYGARFSSSQVAGYKFQMEAGLKGRKRCRLKNRGRGRPRFAPHQPATRAECGIPAESDMALWGWRRSRHPRKCCWSRLFSGVETGVSVRNGSVCPKKIRF